LKIFLAMPATESEFLTIGEPGLAEVRELGSRFFGSALAVESWADVENKLELEQRRYYDATHSCYAARWGIPDIAERSSDAGEPHGTAGTPILQQIRQRGLTNTLVIVTRYFGGTKLGTGGLVRMYGASAGAALDAAVVRPRVLLRQVRILCSFDDMSIVYRLSRKMYAHVEPMPDTLQPEFCCRISPARVAEFSRELGEQSGGRIQVVEDGTWLS
jgi:uncharacterized YigZ family protein